MGFHKDRLNYTIRYLVLLFILCFITVISIKAQVPQPSQIFGFKPGADYKLASYGQMLEYYDRLDATSDRVKKVEIGKTTKGRPMVLLFISSEENLQNLDRWKDISGKLAQAHIDSGQAKKLSQQGKAIVWIDGGMHANELAPAQMTSLLAYRVATESSPEMEKIRKNVVLLLMPNMNPDGLEMWHSWYYDHLNTPYETSNLPWLWQEYAGHDNNRDYFMSNLRETKNIINVLFRQWFPQIVYNHHQPGQGKNWARIVIPPFRSPTNQHIPPDVTSRVSEVGSAMLYRFANKHMPGAMSQTTYSMFWDGGMRTVPYYHNMIGLLSETTQGSPTPRYYDPKDKPETVADHRTDSTSIFYPYPWQGGWSHFRDAVDYSCTASMAVLDYAADRRADLLNGIYTMGRHAIREGKEGDPYAYVITKEQWDSQEANNLVNILNRGGLEIKKATDKFNADGQQYLAGSYIAYASQAFRPYLLDLLEPQHYPKQHEYPGGPPKVPYDLAGWTLPMQMGVNVVRINQSFDAATEAVTEQVKPSAGQLHGSGDYGYILEPKSNVAVKIVNKLLENGATISRTLSETNQDGRKFLAGSYIIRDANKKTLKKVADKYGTDIYSLPSKPDSRTALIKQPKIGLYKSWKANIDEGWTRRLLKQQYGFKVDTLHDEDIRSKNLSQYQSLILPSQEASSMLHGYSMRQMPKKYTGGLGMEGTYALERYTKNGGTLIAFDKASDFLIRQFGLPVRDAVRGLKSKDFFIPGSLIKASINTKNPLAWGMQDTVAASFQRSRAFTVKKQYLRGHNGEAEHVDALKARVDTVVQYAPKASDLLMSGWMLGGKHIAGKPAMIRLPYGSGQIILFAFRPQFRGQPRGTYKLIFNALFGSTMDRFTKKDKNSY